MRSYLQWSNNNKLSTIPENNAEHIPAQHTEWSAEGVTLMTVLNLACAMLCNFFSLNSSISIICFVTVSIRFMIVVPVLKSIKGWSVKVIVNMNCQGQNYSTILTTSHRTRKIIFFHAVAHQLIDTATDQWCHDEAKASGPDLGKHVCFQRSIDPNVYIVRTDVINSILHCLVPWPEWQGKR